MRVPLQLLSLSIPVCVVLTGCVSSVQVPEERPVPVPESPPGPYTTYVTGIPPIVTDRFLLESPDQQIVGQIQVIEARYEDTFVDVARTYNLGFDELVEANPNVDPWLPGAGTRIVLPTRFILPNAPREGIVLNLASKRLFWFIQPDEDGARAVITFPIGIGLQGTATPTGETTITQKVKEPTWFVPAAIRAEYAAEGMPLPKQVPPGPDNPLGSYALLLGMPSYLIHGTNRPAGVGMRVSHGCVRLFPENIELLYNKIPVGEKVTIVDQPWLVGWDDDGLYLEVHQPLEDDIRDWPAILPGLLQEAVRNASYKELPRLDQSRIDTAVAGSQGLPLPVLEGSPGSERYLNAATVVNNIVVLPPMVSEQVAREAPN
jgi:L,D-transpeptidase ErfK/SrfK